MSHRLNSRSAEAIAPSITGSSLCAGMITAIEICSAGAAVAVPPAVPVSGALSSGPVPPPPAEPPPPAGVEPGPPAARERTSTCSSTAPPSSVASGTRRRPRVRRAARRAASPRTVSSPRRTPPITVHTRRLTPKAIHRNSGVMPPSAAPSANLSHWTNKVTARVRAMSPATQLPMNRAVRTEVSSTWTERNLEGLGPLVTVHTPQRRSGRDRTDGFGSTLTDKASIEVTFPRGWKFTGGGDLSRPRESRGRPCGRPDPLMQYLKGRAEPPRVRSFYVFAVFVRRSAARTRRRPGQTSVPTGCGPDLDAQSQYRGGACLRAAVHSE